MENLTNLAEPSENIPSLSEKKFDYFTILLYTDNVRHLRVISDIRSGKYPDATAVLHNLDLADEPTDENPYKKEHVHVVYKFPYRARKSAMETLFSEIESNLIKGVNNPIAIYRYLVHLDDPTKHRYSPNDVFGNTERFYHYYLNNGRLDENEAVCSILDILDNWDYAQGKPTYSKVIRICAEMGLYGHLRKGGTLLSQVIKEAINEYTFEVNGAQWLEDTYIKEKQADEIWRLNSALRSATNTIEMYQRLVK